MALWAHRMVSLLGALSPTPHVQSAVITKSGLRSLVWEGVLIQTYIYIYIYLYTYIYIYTR